MAHNVYPVGWSPPLPPTWVPGTVEYELLWDQLFAAVNGDAGGTWAPGAFITVGGAGLSLTGSGHQIAAGGTLNVQNTAFVRVQNGGEVVLDGTGTADIRLYVTGGVPLIDVKSGAVIRVFSGGALDVFGALTFKDTSGPGSATWENATSAFFNSGSTLQISVGANFSVFSNLRIRGSAFLTVESGATLTLTGNATLGAASTTTAIGGAKLAGDLTVEGKLRFSGNEGRRISRYHVLPDDVSLAADVTVAYDVHEVPASLVNSMVYTVRHTLVGFVPENGEELTIFRYKEGITTQSAMVRRENGDPLFIFANDRVGSVTLIFNASSNEWRIKCHSSLVADTSFVGTGLYGL